MSAALISGLVRASIASQVLWGLAYFRRRHCIFQQIYKLWARSQWTKAIDGDAAAHERKSPQGVNRAGLCRLHFQAANPAQTGQVLMLMLTNGGEYATEKPCVQHLFAEPVLQHRPANIHQISQPLLAHPEITGHRNGIAPVHVPPPDCIAVLVW